MPSLTPGFYSSESIFVRSQLTRAWNRLLVDRTKVRRKILKPTPKIFGVPLTKCSLAWFQWFELSRLYLNISRPQINICIAFTHRLVNKLQKTLKQTRWFLESLRISYGHENKLTKYDITNTEYSFPISARPFLVRFRKALGNRRIFLSWAPRFVQNQILRVDSASCWYDVCFWKGFLTKEKLSKFRWIWPLIGSCYKLSLID